MAKVQRRSRRKTNGKRSPSTQELRYVVTGEKGTTDGSKVGISAVPTAKPQLRRRQPRTTSGRHSNLTAQDIQRHVGNPLASVYLDGARQGKLVRVVPSEVERFKLEVAAALRRAMQ